MAAPLVRGAAQLRRYAAGIAFLAVLALLVGLSIALYTKAFTPVVMVELEAGRIGNQLSVHADVKLRGVLVGEVREVATAGDGARISIALQKDKVHLIPAEVSARLLPKTLFGEKQVDLDVPAGFSSGRAIRAGDVIGQDRSSTAIETEKVLDDFLPLLQSLEPAELSLALNGMSSALRGRGDRIGHNLVLVDSYLRQFNPQLPALQQNFRGLADLADNYDKAAPDLLRLIDDFAAVSRNVVDQKTQLSTFLASTATFAGTSEEFLRVNERSLVELAARSRPVTETYARYSPEFPCVLHALTRQQIEAERTFGGDLPGLHITLEATHDQGAYLPGDEPRFREDRGPSCFGLTGPPVVPFPGHYEPRDGYCDAAEARGPGVETGNCHAGSGAPGALDPALALGGTVQKYVVARAVAPVLALPPDGVPDVATLLFGPVARGGTVSYLLG
jgi:phospholipid/cholesterol/gamma-HCH transport system substrate-binding protein